MRRTIVETVFTRNVKSLFILMILLAGACDSSIVKEAKRAETEKRVVDNQLMTTMYPRAFRPGNPPYLERDFEAGADFICDEILAKYGRDICAEPELNWRH